MPIVRQHQVKPGQAKPPLDYLPITRAKGGVPSCCLKRDKCTELMIRCPNITDKEASKLLAYNIQSVEIARARIAAKTAAGFFIQGENAINFMHHKTNESKP